MKRRVVVTGVGIVSPLGSTLGEFADALFRGQSGAGRIQSFDSADLPVQIAAEVKATPSETYRDRKIGFAIDAACQATRDWSRGPTSPIHCGLSLGIGLELFDMGDLIALAKDADAATALPFAQRLTFLQTPSDLCAHTLSHRFGLHAPPQLSVSACAASSDAIGHAFRAIRSGRRRVMLCGGSDSMINPLGVGGFCKLRALSTRNETPSAASRPFDADRDGFVLGEGAAMLLLESLDDALARDATIYGEVLGYGSSLDAHGISEPHPQGRGAILAMRKAIDDSQLSLEAVDCINAHGSSTPKNDAMETHAIRSLFGNRAARIPVVSTKSMIGHLIAASGAAEIVAALLCLQHQTLHPTINLETPDPVCDLDYVPNIARQYPHKQVLCNSFGFGGQNASLVLRRWT